MVSMTLTVLLAFASGGGQTRPDSKHEVVIDLAALESDATHRITVPAEQELRVQMVNRLPGHLYALRETPDGGSGSATFADARRVEDEILPLQRRPDCAHVASAAAGLLAADTEATLARQLAPGGPLDRVAGAGGCPEAKAALARLRELARHSTGFPGPDAGKGISLTIERLGRGPLTLELMRPGAAAERTWRIRLEAQAAAPAWRYSSEEEWILDVIGRDVAEMALFASQGTLPREGPRLRVERAGSERPAVYDLALHGVAGPTPLRLRITIDWLWSPQSWGAFAGALLKGVSTRSTPAPPRASGSLLESLADPRVRTLQRENQRVSDWLRGDPRSPDAHEQAALVLAAFALGEAAGPFSDARLTLCRLTAHLAVARGLRAGRPPDREGLFAEAVLLTLLGRERAALAALSAVTDPRPEERPWLNALRLRNTADWRLLPTPLTATLLERREHYRAVAASLGGLHALEFARKRNSERIPDWGRISLEGDFTVGEGGAFADTALGLELAEASELLARDAGDERSRSALVAALNEPPGLCLVRGGGAPVPEVISRGAWGSYYQRHISAAVAHADSYRRRLLGLPKEADEAWSQARSRLAGLDLLPLLAVHVARERERSGERTQRALPSSARGEACRGAFPIPEQHPERVTAGNWDVLQACCTDVARAPVSGYKRWFGEGIPEGTTFEAVPRLSLVGGKGDLPLLGKLRDLAPDDSGIARAYVRRRYYLAPPTLAQFDEAYGKLVEYDLAVMKDRATLVPADRDATRAMLEQVCDLDRDSCVALGTHLAAHDLDDDAARAFQRAVDEGLDRVGVSNNVGWLVDYYLDRGQDQRARAVARFAADVYSARGLATMGRYSERRGDEEDAERRYKMVAERYSDPEYLRAFYIRADLRAPGGRFAAEADAARAVLFRQGLERVALRDLQGMPADGVRIVRSLPRLERLGLDVGDVIVAVNGYRVHDTAQFDCLRALLDAREATVIVWHGGLYDEVRAPLARPNPAMRFETLGGGS